MAYLPRIADRTLKEALATFPVVRLDGARATGKTTSCARLAASQLRFPRDLALFRSDPEGVLARLTYPALIDEWQLAGTDLLWTVKGLVDADPRPGRFLLAGSVDPGAYGPTYPLTGRGASIMMRPMTRRELLDNGSGPLWLERLMAGDLLRPGTGDGTALDVALLERTGFPGAPARSGTRPWLAEYATMVADRNIDNRRDPTRVARTIRVLATLEAEAVPDERIFDSSGINRATWLSYDAMLRHAHVATPSPAWQSNRLARITSYPKRYLADTALAMRVADVDAATLGRDPALAGRYLESYVAAQVRPEVDVLGGTMHHVRTRGGEREIDVLIDVAGRLVALEVKHTTRPSVADAKHLAWLKSELGPDLTVAAVLHRGSATFELTPGVWAVPIASLWE